MFFKDLNLTTFIFLTKITAVQNEVALSYHKVRGLYFCIDYKPTWKF